MSEENVEVVVRMVHAWASGDRDSARAAWDPHAVMIRPVIDSQVLHGLPAIEAAQEAWRRSWQDYRLEIEGTIDGGETVVVTIRQHGVGKETGALVELLTHGVFNLRSAKIIRVEFFDSKQDALEAAGLQE
jgi:ketosteroid isomerase-like protein